MATFKETLWNSRVCIVGWEESNSVIIVTYNHIAPILLLRVDLGKIGDNLSFYYVSGHHLVVAGILTRSKCHS